MLKSHSRKLFAASLLLPAALWLGGATAHAQERLDAELDEPARLSSAPSVAAKPSPTDEREASPADTKASESADTSVARFVSAVSESAALRQGLKFDASDGARAGVDAFDAPPHKAPAWASSKATPMPQSAAPPTPLTSGEKMSRAFKRAFLSPMPYASAAFSATLTQLGEDDLPHKTTGDKVADGLTRMAINFGRSATRTIFTGGIYASLFKQDPRYDRSQGKGIGGKVLHAVSRVFVTRDDDWNIEPNYSRFAGVMTASALSNAWERSTPGHDRIGLDATLRRFAKSFLNDAITNILFRELLPDIF